MAELDGIGLKKKSKKTALTLSADDYLRFEQLLFNLSANFINLPEKDIDKEIKNALKLLGEFLGIDRVTLTQFDESEVKLISTHYYMIPGISPPSARTLNTDIPWFFQQMRQGKMVALEHLIDKLPRNALTDREYVRTYGIKSVIAIPMRLGKTILGGLFFTAIQNHLPMPEEMIQRLILASEILTKTLGRKNAWEQIQKHTRFEQLLTEISAMFIHISQDELENKIRKGLSMIGEHLDVDFIFLRWLQLDQEGYRLIHQWQRTGVTLPRTVSLAPENTPWLFSRLHQNRSCEIYSIDDFPKQAEKDKETAMALGIKSFICVPFITKNMFRGSITVGTINEPKRWAKGIADRLKLFGEVISNSILRVQAENKLRTALKHVKELKEQIEAECSYLRDEIKLEHNYSEIIGNSKTLNQTLLKVEQVAKTNTTVLILGKTGTGKELIARAIHNASDRRDKPLIKMNCAALPANLIESELFGHVKGAFSGAHTSRTGRFEIANGATLFLDEVGELPVELQPKLLRVLQEREYEKLGSSKTIKTNVRVIAATNRDLKNEIKAGRFRQDLWYRLNVFPIIVPPLSERKEDIPLLANWFVSKYNKKIGKNIDRIPKKAIAELKNHNWTGNVRELQNVLERAVITSQGRTLQLELAQKEKGETTVGRTLEEVQRQYILSTLEETKWTIEGKKGASHLLGLKPSTLRNRMKKFGINRP